MKNKKYYETSDLALTTTISLFFPIKSIDSSNKTRVIFVFDRSQKIDELVKKYWDGNLKVEPQKFFNQLKIIKTRLYS